MPTTGGPTSHTGEQSESLRRAHLLARHSQGKQPPVVLLTLGRLPVALELARAMHSAGWRVLVAEPWSWHLCRLSNTVHKSFKVTAPTLDKASYLAELRQIIQREKVSLVLPVSEEILHVSELKNQLPESVRVVSVAQNELLLLHDKYRFMQFAQAHQLPVPQTLLLEDRHACAELMKKPFVVKPRFSCSGSGVHFGTGTGTGTGTGRSESAMQSVFSDADIVQERLFGASCCSFSIVDNGAVLSSVCYRSLLESGSVSVCFEKMAVPDDIAFFIKSIVVATSHSGMIAFDFIQDDEGVWRAIECNPRATSGLHFLDHQDVLADLVGSKPKSTPSESESESETETETETNNPERRQEFWTCLMQVEGALFKGRLDSAGWRMLFSTRDITWRRADMKPFLLMSFVMAPQLFRAIKVGKPVSQLLMDDLVWRDEKRQ